MTSVKLSSDVERILVEVRQQDDEFDSRDFCVIDYVNSHFSDLSASSLDAFCDDTQKHLTQKKENLFNAVSNVSIRISDYACRISQTKDSVIALQTRVSGIQEQTLMGEEIVKHLSTHIHELDVAKSNLTASINALRSIEMWLLQLNLASSSFEKRNYVVTRDALLEALKYQSQFSKESLLPRVKELTDRLILLSKEIEYFVRNTIFGDLALEAINNKELADVCAIIDLMGEDSRRKIRDKLIDRALESYSVRFRRGTEDAKLERTERRYVYIRGLLENFSTAFANVFPRRWCVPQELCVSFCLRTKQELDYQLQESSGKMNVVVLTYVLEKTIDIERELTQLMAWQDDFVEKHNLPSYKYNGLILSAFKDHMHLFVENEDRLLGNALAAYSLLGEGDHKFKGWDHEEDERVGPGTVLPLSEDIFIFISQSLKRSLRISQPDVLLEISGIWRKYLRKLSQDLLSVLPAPAMAPLDIHRACLVVSTARFCQSTSHDLGREIVVRSEASEKDVGFHFVCTDFAEVYSKGIQSLVHGIEMIVTPLLNTYASETFMASRELNADGLPTHEECRLIRTISIVIHNFFLHCANILSSQILRFVVEKMAANVIPLFVGCLYRRRKMPDDAVHIMRVDAVALEKTVLQLPNYNAPNRFSPEVLTSFTKLVRREFGHLHRALKVLQVCTTIDVLADVYYEVMLPEDRSIQNFVRLAELKDFRREELRECIVKLSRRGVVEATKRDLERESTRGLNTGASS